MEVIKTTRSKGHRILRPRMRLGLGKSRSKQPIIAKRRWPWLPYWIALHAERGRVHKCWFGHRLLREAQDGRKHRPCVWCEQKPSAGSPIMACRKCNWTVCSTCTGRPRLPPLEVDPLFHGPHSPRLLPPSQLPDSSSRGTVIICPGGNYEFLVPHEGMPPAEWLAANGIRAFVLRYRHLPDHDLEDMLEDLQNAVALVRRVHRGPVAAMGFSAGGHLVACHAIRAGARKAAGRPLDAQLLVYPCIDASDWVDPENCGFFNWEESFPKAQTLMAERSALLGGEGFAAPPTFLVASTADEASPPKDHTDPYARALKRTGVPCTYLRRNFGPHGFGLEGGWTDKCVGWLRSMGFGGADGERGVVPHAEAIARAGG